MEKGEYDGIESICPHCGYMKCDCKCEFYE